MQVKSSSFLWAVPLVCCLACSGGDDDDTPGGGADGDARRFVPEGLTLSEENGEGGLTLVALTLVQGASSAELYAAIKNEGDAPACSPGMTIDFLDGSDQVVSSAGTSVQSAQFYRLDNGTGAAIPCIAPGEIGMTAATTLPASVVIADLGALKYQFPAFGVPDIVAIDAFRVSGVRTVSVAGGSAYQGTFINQLAVGVTEAKVSLFPVNRVGRPLAVTSSSATTEVAPGGSWSFESSAVADLGVGHVDFPTASIP